MVIIKAILFASVFIGCVRCINNDESLWHSYQFGTGHGNREELIVTDITSDENFYLGKEVVRWKSITIKNKCYSVGLMHAGVIVLTSQLDGDKDKFVITRHIFEHNSSLIDFELFENWNNDLQQPEIITVIATSGTNPKLLWCKITNDGMQHFWMWPMHKRISHLHYLKLFDDNQLLLIINEDAQGTSADLYKFTFQDYWHFQTIPLAKSANNSAINSYGSNLFLSIPQNDMVTVYKLVENKFRHYQNITSRNVSNTASFKIGFKSFLAIGGEDAGIYKFTASGIRLEQIDGLLLKHIDFWLPVPIKTYRDEVMLIMQRIVHFDPHRSYLLEVVLYDGTKFVRHDEIPCSFFGEKEHGLACMVDHDGVGGIAGSTILSVGKILGVLVPRKETSALFMIQTTMKERKSPVEIEVEKLEDTRVKLQKMMDQQQLLFDGIQERLKNSIKLNETNKIEAPWRVNTISAPALEEKMQIVIPMESQTMEDVDLGELKIEIDKIKHGIDDARNMLMKAVDLTKDEVRISELVFEGELEVLGKSYIQNVVAETFHNENVSEAFNDLVKKNEIKPIFGHKTFTDVDIGNINVASLNGLDISQLIANNEGPLIFNETVEFHETVTIMGEIIARTGKINDYDLANEVVQMHHQYEDPIKFEHIKTDIVRASNLPIAINVKTNRDGLSDYDVDEMDIDLMEIFGNITIENVNGENFDDFLKTICFTNIDTFIPGDTFIDGVLNVEGNADIRYLNGVQFLDEYIFQNTRFVQITGKKTFQEVFANEVIVDGSINGIHPEDIFTRSNNQTLQGTFTFNDLEITEEMTVDGKIDGTYMDKFLKNPKLTETHQIKSNVNFKSLEVQGAVLISDKFNDVDFNEKLNDVLYAHEDEATISSIKTFLAGFTVINGLSVASESINDIPITSFITKNTEQTILFPTLNGPTSFENLILGGLFGDVNISKLLQETVKLTGEQFVSTTLIFNNNNDLVDLSATDFHIIASLNNLTESDFIFITGDSRSLRGSYEFENLSPENLFIEGDLTGNLIDFSLKDFDDRRLSYTKDQVITGKYSFQNFEAEHLRSKLINGRPFDESTFNPRYYQENLSKRLFGGELKIKNLLVNGSVLAEEINGINVKNIQSKCVWTDKNNYLNNGVMEGDVIVNKLFLNTFNGVDLKVFVDNIVFKTDQNPVISSFKTFVNGLHVTKMLNSELLNDVHVDHILTKTGTQQISGPLQVHGDVVINKNCEIYEHLNDVNIPFLSQTYQITDDACIINDDLFMQRLPYIKYLNVEGYANEENLNDVLSNLVYKSHNIKITSQMTFLNTVQINQNLIVTKTLNDIDLSEFVDEIVYITNDDTIDVPITFTQEVCVEEDLIIESDLTTGFLIGINLDVWKNEAVFINRGKLSGNLTFESVTIHENVFLNYINNVDLNSLIPLRTDQHIPQGMNFWEITPFSNIDVGQTVNGLHLPTEYSRTYFTNGVSQVLNNKLIFEGVLEVQNNLVISGSINGKNISQVVTTNTNQNLYGAYVFLNDVTIESNLIIYGDVNGININDWQKRSVRSYAEYLQYIYDVWNVDGNITFHQNVEGGGFIDGIDVRKMADEVERKRLLKITTQSAVMNDYEKVCKFVNTIRYTSQNQIYLFQYLETLQTLEIDNAITNVHYFKHKNDEYMLVSENGSCMSHLFIWSKYQFQPLGRLETGSISECISVYDGELLFLVSRSDEISLSTCQIHGTNVWKFQPGNLSLLSKIDDYKILQESLVDGAFYGLNHNYVVEYRIVTVVETNVKKYRKWTVNEVHSENLAFVPRGLATGLALHNGHKLIRLNQDPVKEEDFGYETEAIEIGSFTEEANTYFPGYNDHDPIVINVGYVGVMKSLFAIASHEETSVKGRLDFIKIYEDVLTGKLFHKVPAYKPSSLTSLEFENGETLLIFLENGKMLQVYEYKGLEGFKHRSVIKLEGSKLFTLSVQMESNIFTRTKILGAINKNKIHLIQTIMTGNRVSDMDEPLCKV